MNEIRVVLADDHPVVRAGIKSMLDKEPDIRVVGEVSEGSAIARFVEQAVPDILVLDVNMPALNPVAVTRELKTRRPDLQILVLTAYDNEEYVLGLLAAGATGYVLKDEALDALAAAIRATSKGESYLSQKVAARLARRAVATRESAAEDLLLTAREREVLRLLALGFDNDAIADKLVISKRTVQNHVSAIYSKLNLASRAEAILYAIRHKLVDVNEVKEP
jgi:DNA-binding NarL/FixJ family response regulator